MSKVTIYTTATCPYCVQAKLLLSSKNIAYDEIRVDLDSAQRVAMENLTGKRTVPQIIINDKPIGGYTDLYALNRSGELDKLLA